MEINSIFKKKKNVTINTVFSLFLIAIFLFSMIGSVFIIMNNGNNNIVKIDNTKNIKSENLIISNPPTPISSKISGSGFDITDAINVPMVNGTGNVLSHGSMLGQLDASNSYIFYQFNLAQSGPVDIAVSTPLGTDVFQLFFDVYSDINYNYLDSASSGNPVTYSYTAQQPGFNYIAIGGFNYDPNYDIFNGATVSFNLTVILHKQGIATAGSVSTRFQSDAYHKISNIFSYFNRSSYTSPYPTTLYDSVDLTKGNFDNSTYLDPTDPGYYKGIGLSIYGIVRAADFLTNSNNMSVSQQLDTTFKYLNYANSLFKLANSSNNLFNNGTYALYVRPQDKTTGYLSDNAYMLMGISEIIYFANRNQVYYTDPTFYDSLFNWTAKLTQSVNDIFQDTAIGLGVFPEESYNLGGTVIHGNLVYLESMSILAEDFSELNVLNFYNNSIVTLIPDFFLTASDIQNQIVNHLLITTDINTTINLVTSNGPTTGIGVEYWNASSNQKSNTSTLDGNLAFAEYLTSNFDYTNASDIALNLLNLFTVPGTFLLKNKALIINDGTNLPSYISTLSNSEFILLAQRLQIKWHDGFNVDASRSWGKKALDNYNDLVNLLYDNVDNAFFGMYDANAKVIVSNDNNILSNRFVANAFINSILVRLFPVQLGIIASNNQIVGNYAQLSLELSQIAEFDSVNWWDFLIPFTFQLEVAIPEFSYTSTQNVNLADFVDFSQAGLVGSSEFISQIYKPMVKGNYTVYITLTEEGQVLLSQKLELTALGQISAEFTQSDLVFSTDQSSFTAMFTLIDDNGIAVPNLNVNTSLGTPLDKHPFKSYIKKGRSDASGKVSVSFDVSKLFKDSIINETAILQMNPIPSVVSITLYVNVTNAASQNLQQAETQLKIPVKAVLSQMDARISPTVLQIVQGTTDAFTFVVTVLNQNQDPVANANITYSINGVPGSTNTVFTSVDGEATVTFRDNILFGLSNLAIAAKGSTNTSINFKIQQSSYPTKTIQKSISILANQLKITANPVQLNIKQPSVFDSNKISPIDVEVAVQDSFGRIVPAEVSLAWNDTSLDKTYNLADLGTHIAPYTFSIDPNKLPVGELNFMIIARKDGITTTHQVTNPSQVNSKISSTNKLGQSIIDNPVIISRKIIVEASTISDILVSLVGILSGLIIAKVVTMFRERGEEIVGYTRSCPYCEEYISPNVEVCSHCGRDVEPVKKNDRKGKGSKVASETGPIEQSLENQETEQESQEGPTISKEDQELIDSTGAPDLKTAQDIMKAGFSDYATYKQAKDQGFSTFMEWESRDNN